MGSLKEEFKQTIDHLEGGIGEYEKMNRASERNYKIAIILALITIILMHLLYQGYGAERYKKGVQDGREQGFGDWVAYVYDRADPTKIIEFKMSVGGPNE